MAIEHAKTSTSKEQIEHLAGSQIFPSSHWHLPPRKVGTPTKKCESSIKDHIPCDSLTYPCDALTYPWILPRKLPDPDASFSLVGKLSFHSESSNSQDTKIPKIHCSFYEKVWNFNGKPSPSSEHRETLETNKEKRDTRDSCEQTNTSS